MTESEIRNVIIVGSGPAGWTAAIYTARAALNPLIVEGAVEAGGALMNTTEVENFPGFPEGIMGPDLMLNMKAQAQRFGAEVVTEDVVELNLAGAVKTVTIGSGETYRAKAIILATGSGYRRLGIPGEDLLSGKGVSWCATCDGFFFRGKKIAVVGGGDSAAEEATFLSRFGESVTLVHRRDELRASAIMAERVAKDPKIQVAWNSAPTSINGTNKVESLTLTDTVTGDTRELAVDGVFIAIGHDPRSQLFANQITCDEQGYVVVDAPTTRTSLPGVFACGDLVDHTYRQAITAAGTGCQAALDAEHFLAE